ncbi:ABC transporter [Candidatus Izimaplasma bacterium ZiA1]|uniref:ABC transporter ATP-binding protein n=1 Tax=Candidatus Izimoplasma sp. ZiA1 TaxID=2024899 RepID=UPI000BAA7527|nr:ABC transporter [Candidatus Izimaplasma bacterium ZiA1]
MKRFKQFFKWMKGNIWIYVFSIALLVVLQYFRTLTPLFVQHTIDFILDTKESLLPDFLFKYVQGDTIKESLLLVGIVFVLVSLFRVIVMFLRRLVNAVFTERIAYNMRNTLYKKLQDLSFTYHSHAETGDLIQRCTTDIETYRVFVGEQLIEIIRLVFLMIFTIFQMSKINTQMTFISLIIAPIIFFSAFIYFLYVKKIFKKVEEAEGKMTTTLQESVTGIRVVKAFAREKFEIDKFEEDSKRYMKEDYKLLKLMAAFWGGTDFIIFVQYFVTALVGIHFAIDGVIDTGEYIAFLSYVGMVVWPLRQLGRIVGDFGKTTVALDRLDEIVLKESEHLNDSPDTPIIEGKVEFKNVGFKFEDDNKSLLKNISFDVEKGQTVAIVGKTGSGKSTLINLMVRLLEYQQGEILFDGKDLKTINKKWIRKNVGIILQEPFLYSKSIYENISIMDRKADKEKIYKAASIASLHDDIEGFEAGYKTLVGERGVTLSGGQKQRVAIARMLLDSKPILIFDDSLSAVDTETDIQIRRSLNKYWANTTVFIITHRITTAMEADKIVVLDQGEVKEMGTHDQLLKQNGIYNDLWEIQTNVEYDYKKIDKGAK